jgi:hypothetical protein
MAVEVQARDCEMTALGQLGDAELALGRHEAASQAYRQLRALTVELGSESEQHYVSSRLAAVSLAQGDIATAMREIEVMLSCPASGTAEGLDPEVELTCYHVLAAARDARAAERLQLAYSKLQAEAATITDDALRERFLAGVPVRRAIEAAWKATLAP